MKNAPGNYCLEQRQNAHVRDAILYPHGAGGVPCMQRLPGNGFGGARIQPYQVLSDNSTDIESFLRGINSNNMVDPAPPLVPELNCVQSINMFVRPQVIMPEPNTPLLYQRPFPF